MKLVSQRQTAFHFLELYFTNSAQYLEHSSPRTQPHHSMADDDDEDSLMLRAALETLPQ